MNKTNNTENDANKNKKQCSKCKSYIDLNAKKCPNCGSRQGTPIWVIVLAILGVLILFSFLGDDSSNSDSSINNGFKESEQQTIEYIKVSKDDLDEELKENAAAAKEKYNKKYVEVTGKLGVIDSDLKYISLVSSTDEWDFLGIHCTIKTKEQKEIVKTLKKDQEITIKGKITDVGEVLGYYLDITEIIAN